MRIQRTSQEARAARRYRSLLSTALLALSPLSSAAGQTPAEATPAPRVTPLVVVQIKCVPGGREAWRRAFEDHIEPALREATESGEILGFSYFEAIVPGQPYDFMLMLSAESFSFFDRRRPFPHWAALFRRAGAEEGRRILGQMQALESSISVSLLRSYGPRP